MRNFLQRHSKFVGNVAIIMSGRTVAALIAFFTIPIVARLYVPDDFGVAAVFVSIASILSTIATLRYESAVVLPEKDSDAITLFAIAFLAAISFSSILILLIGTYQISGFEWQYFELLGSWQWIVPIAVFFLAALHAQESWITRTQRFKLASASLVAQNTITTGSRILFGAVFGSSVHGLIAGYMLGLFSRIALLFDASRSAISASPGRAKLPCFKELAREYSDFPKLNAPAGLIFSTGQNMPVLLFGIIYSPAVAGLTRWLTGWRRCLSVSLPILYEGSSSRKRPA
jgi:O-antigen/teichoic acid export membrane protein